MRRYLVIFAGILFLLAGCAGKNAAVGNSGTQTFYYAAEGTEQLTTRSAVGSETRTVQVYTLKQLLDLYFSGPATENLKAPFPAGTRLIAISETEDGIKLTLSGEFFTLQGVDLSIASCCLVMTVNDYLNVEQITLSDEMERISLQLRTDDFLLENHFTQESGSIYTLYFSDEANRYLIAETREVTLSENEAPELYVLRQLMQGPTRDGLKSIIPSGTVLLGVDTQDGICKVDFSEEFYQASENEYVNYTTIAGVVNTLTSLENISAVQFFQDGQAVANYGVFSLAEPLRRNAGCIGPVRRSGTEMDVNVYVISPDQRENFAVPVRVKMTTSQPLAEAVAEAAIGYEATFGLINPIPYGTRVLTVSVSGGVCYLDVSKEFIPSDGTKMAEQAAVWSIVSALTDLDEVKSVLLTIEGESHGLQSVDISEPLTKKDIALD